MKTSKGPHPHGLEVTALDIKGAPPTKQETKDFGKYAEMMAHAIMAPLITWPGCENDFVDKIPDVKIARLAKLMKGDFEEAATDLEVSLYISGFTLSAGGPPSHELFDVYMYAFRKAFGDELTDKVLGPDEGKKLEEFTEKGLYNRTRHWIYERQKEHLKAKGKMEKKDEPKQTIAALSEFL